MEEQFLALIAHDGRKEAMIAWARAYAGWPHFTAAAPNAAHHAFAAWEAAGTLVQLVTQNVDRLHQRAGSRSVIDLHGRLDVVVCMDCGERTSREAVQGARRTSNNEGAWAIVQRDAKLRARRQVGVGGLNMRFEFLQEETSD